MKVLILEFNDLDTEVMKNDCINLKIQDLRKEGYTIKNIYFGFSKLGYINSVAIVYEDTKIEKWEV